MIPEMLTDFDARETMTVILENLCFLTLFFGPIIWIAGKNLKRKDK